MPAGLSIHFLSVSLSEERERKIVLSLFVDKMTEKENGFCLSKTLIFFLRKVFCSLSNIYWIWKQFYLSKCIPLHASNNNSNQKLCLIETHKYCFIAFKVNFDEVIKSDCKIKLPKLHIGFFQIGIRILLFLFCSAFNGSIEKCNF